MIVIDSWLSDLFHVVLTIGFLVYSYRLSKSLND